MSQNDIGNKRPPCYLCEKPAMSVFNHRFVCGECCIKLIKAKEKEELNFVERFKKI